MTTTLSEQDARKYLDKLDLLKQNVGPAHSCGLSHGELLPFIQSQRNLRTAIDKAVELQSCFIEGYPELSKLPEAELLGALSEGFLNFYRPETVSPYVPLAAKGPWIVTFSGGVVYDTGGYGMLGQGHEPDLPHRAMSSSHVMANIMTPSFSQRRFVDNFRKVVGSQRPDKSCPYDRIICMNSGSEAMAVGMRISDAHAKRMTDEGGRYAGAPIMALSFQGSFHGRTMRPARISHSTRAKYLELASFRDIEAKHAIIPPNDIEALRREFGRLVEDGVYIEAVVLEPVMGEGNPGLALSRAFYDEVRKLTREHGSLLLIDSIQAGFRAQGVLSIVDYPEFLDCDPPDMESFSKALNAGQYPLSVLGMTETVAKQYVLGTYGNTMTANPRALDVGSTVLEELSPELTRNIREKGKQLAQKLTDLMNGELKGLITKVQGTGLLVSAELRDGIDVVGDDAVEQRMRRAGVNIIHGGKNSLRYTPWFWLSSDEIDLICDASKKAILSVANQ